MSTLVSQKVQPVNSNVLVLDEYVSNENMFILVSKKVQPVTSNALVLEDNDSNMSTLLTKNTFSWERHTLWSSVHDTPMCGVVLIGDSILLHSGRKCAKNGALLDVNLSARIAH